MVWQVISNALSRWSTCSTTVHKVPSERGKGNKRGDMANQHGGGGSGVFVLPQHCTVLYRRVPAISKYKRWQVVTGHKVAHIGNMVNFGEEIKFPVDIVSRRK